MVELTESLKAELKDKYNPEGSTLRKSQLRMLEMLKFIDEVCTENGLTYWIDSGTLLGAVRHGGYIPWDDDIDILMPRKDYLKFRRIMLHQNKSADFVLQCYKTDPNSFVVWPRIVDLKSKYIWQNKYEYRKYQGLNVDVFVVTDIFNQKINDGIWHFYRDYVVHAKDVGKSLTFVKFNFMLVRLMSFFAYLWGAVFDRKKDSYYQLYGSYFTDEVHRKQDILPVQRIRFENVLVNAPCNADSYLKDIYGPDYMLIPDEDKRACHCLDVIFL